jgi:hypothetical protein
MPAIFSVELYGPFPIQPVIVDAENIVAATLKAIKELADYGITVGRMIVCKQPMEAGIDRIQVLTEDNKIHTYIGGGYRNSPKVVCELSDDICTLDLERFLTLAEGQKDTQPAEAIPPAEDDTLPF